MDIGIPQQLEHHWLAVDPAPERQLFQPGTREFYFLDEYGTSPKAPALPGAARAYLEVLMPVHRAWAGALADETARLVRPDRGADYDRGRHSRYLRVYEIGEDDPKGGGEVDRYLGPFRNPYPGLQLRSWAVGSGTVGIWAREQSDAADPEKSRTSRRAAGRNAARLQPTAEAEYRGFRTALNLWADEARPWIDGAQAAQPVGPAPRRAVNLR